MRLKFRLEIGWFGFGNFVALFHWRTRRRNWNFIVDIQQRRRWWRRCLKCKIFLIVFFHIFQESNDLPEHGGGGGGGGAAFIGEVTTPDGRLFFAFWFTELLLLLASDVEDMFGVKESFRLFETASNRLWHWEHATLVVLGDLNNLWVSSCFSISVARWTSVSADSQIVSLIGSFESILSKCCRILRKWTACGVSDTWTMKNKILWENSRIDFIENYLL